MSAPIWTRFTENYFRYPVDYSLMDQFNLTANIVRQVEALCREDAYNIVAYKHLGDVFYFLGAKEALEKTFGGKVHYILLPQHEFLAKLWRKFFNALFVFTMFFGGGLIPTFILMNQLRLVNTVWAILLPGAFNVWNMILARTYYQSVSSELWEAAQLDGANEIQYFF